MRLLNNYDSYMDNIKTTQRDTLAYYGLTIFVFKIWISNPVFLWFWNEHILETSLQIFIASFVYWNNGLVPQSILFMITILHLDNKCTE